MLCAKVHDISGMCAQRERVEPDAIVGQETSEVVELERLRPCSGHTQSGFMRRVFRIAPGQEANMARTKDQLPKLAKLAELFALNISPDGKSLVGIGLARSLDTAQGLLDMHMKRLPQLAQVAMQEEQIKSRLKQVEEQKNYRSSVTFRVPSKDYMGMGRSNCNL